MQHITIKDIARLADVSVTTVSRALNDAPGIHSETRDRILRVCRENGYRANLLAKSLSSSRSNLLAFVVPDMSSVFHATLALNIELCAQEAGYQMMFCSSRPENEQLENLFDFLYSQRVDGILLSSTSESAYALAQRCQGKIPCILLGACAPEDSQVRANTVSVDNYAGGRMAAEYLYSLGHRNVAYLGYRSGSTTHALRYRGFLSAAAELDMAVQTLPSFFPASTIENGYHLARSFLSQSFSETAIFAVSDAVALGVIQAAAKLNISVPDQLSILGFDGIEYTALPKIRLATLSQNTPQLARAAVRLLMELIENGDQGEYTRKLITPTVIQRASCRAI